MDKEEDVDRRKKRNREEEEEEESIKLFEKMKRDRFESFKSSLDIDFNFDPPWVTECLAFTVNYQKDMIKNLTTDIMAEASKGQWKETEDYIKELGNMIKSDPRLGDFLEDTFLKFLVVLLGNGSNPKLQYYASIVLLPVIAYSKNNKGAVVKYITASTVVNLLHSLDSEVREQAMWLLRTIALAYSDCDEHKNILEGSLDTLIPLLVDCTTEEVLSGGVDALEAICQVHPNLSLEKLKRTVSALVKLIESERLNVVASACMGLAFLCDGKERMVVDHQDIGTLVDHLTALIDSDSCQKTRAGLVALGSIVRWGSDDDIEIIIKKEVLWSLECLLREEDKYMVKDSCWIISNIAAGKESHVSELIDCECIITSLVRVVETYELLDVKIEAAWAISNAIYGVSSDRKEVLKNKCGKPMWNLMKILGDNQQAVILCLEGLAGLGVLTVTSNGREMNVVDWLTEFKKLLLKIERVHFQLADTVGGLTKPKKLQRVDNIEKATGDRVFNLTCTFKDLHQSDLQKLVLQVYSSSEEDMRCAWMYGDETGEQMEVDIPK